MPGSPHAFVSAIQNLMEQQRQETLRKKIFGEPDINTSRPSHMTPGTLMQLRGIDAVPLPEGLDESEAGLDNQFEANPRVFFPPSDEDILNALANGLGTGI